jgi:hypothetical protein
MARLCLSSDEAASFGEERISASKEDIITGEKDIFAKKILRATVSKRHFGGLAASSAGGASSSAGHASSGTAVAVQLRP